MNKKCFRCGETKDVSEFYCHKEMKDGHINKCKECTKRDVRENYRKNKKHYQSYEARRAETIERKEYSRLAEKRHRARYPEKYKARTAVSNAIRDGRLTKEPCCLCGSMFSQAHHEDYTKPLEVKWYCKQCHPITGR